jgi:uncharacterized membrane protein YraQ (UPF0718 family)
MIEVILAYFGSLYHLLYGLWLWLVLGFFIAALIREFVPTEKIMKYFGDNSPASLVRAAFSGLFLSVCSCGAIPIAATLRERGASTAAALTFLLATPWAGFIHLVVLSNFVGLPNTLLLFVFSMTVAVISGVIFSVFERKGWIEQPIHSKHVKGEKHSCLDCQAEEEKEKGKIETSYRLRNNVPKHFLEISWDIGKYMLIGFLLAAGVATFVDHSVVTQFLGEGGILLAVPLSAVIETCSEGFTILAGQLFTMGASLGVVFTMTMVGVTTDLTELSMLWGKFGRRSTIVYLVVSTVVVVLFAYGINAIT